MPKNVLSHTCCSEMVADPWPPAQNAFRPTQLWRFHIQLSNTSRMLNTVINEWKITQLFINILFLCFHYKGETFSFLSLFGDKSEL